MFIHARTERRAAGGVKECLRGNLQAPQDIHYALSAFCKLEKQLNWYSVFDIQDKKNGQESHRGEANSSVVRGQYSGLAPAGSKRRREVGENWLVGRQPLAADRGET